MREYTNNLHRGTPQDRPIPGREAVMTPNQGGGYSFAVDHWGQLRRFLILGADKPTYYADVGKRVTEATAAMKACFAEDGPRTIQLLVDVSDAGRGVSNDPALLALAYGFTTEVSLETRQAAAAALPKVARIGTHLFHFVEALKAFGKRPGSGRLLQRAMQDWYVGREPDALAYQLIKYQQRDGWSHRDLLRLCKPGGRVEEGSPHAQLFAAVADQGRADRERVTRGRDVEWSQIADSSQRWVQLVLGTDWLRADRTEGQVIRAIRDLNLPREVVPSEHLRSPRVWKALLHAGRGMPLGALLRNLGKLTSVGALQASSRSTQVVTERLADADALKAARVHPFAVLKALAVYRQGHGQRGSLTWQPVPAVIDALDAAFYAAFGAVTPTGKRLMLALDVSGSMGWTSNRITGCGGLTAREGAGAMAMVTAATERGALVTAFSDGITPVDVSPRRRLDDNLRTINALRMGATDCSLPMRWAQAHNVEVDTFVVYTDNETNTGSMHPAEALVDYRRRTGIPARLVVVAMASNGFSIADPADGGMLDVVGFDTAAPELISAFARAEF